MVANTRKQHEEGERKITKEREGKITEQKIRASFCHILKMSSLVSSHDLLKTDSTSPWCLENITLMSVSHDEMA